MKLRIALAGLTIITAFGGSGLAAAQQGKDQPTSKAPADDDQDEPEQKPGKDWMTKEQVTEKLKAAGYSNVEGLGAYNNRYEGAGTKNGKEMEFDVDPKSGKVTFEQEAKDDEGADDAAPPAKKK